ncbi:DUF4115 domain-containing protein [Permianibacter sp. IMCC34836]|uniref:RodZ domain-containing protein n=1 Tax=Permianibacter fluminis TaxID=2738515 RepID=UPI001551AB61|nr:RodZ domain-containing protein [Permianibacter fluminis]NQD38633.1 DUF4115 domain-containing protein [Permianibacter fluminis]
MAELTTEAAPVAAPRVGPGARLKAGREAQKQSLEQAARHLRLDEPTLAAIESDHYPAHVPSTFLRGYLRAYAKWLELPADEIVAAYNEQQPNEATLAGLKSLLPLPESGRSRSSKWLWLSMLAIVLIVVVVAVIKLSPGNWLEQMRLADSSVSATDSTATLALPPETTSGELSLQLAPEEPVTDAEVVPEAETETAASTESVAAKPDPATKPSESASKPATSNSPATSASVVPVSTSAAEPVSGSGELLEFAFIEDCWIRVTDAGGSVLSVGIKQKGNRIRLSGQAPLTVVLGNPSGVQLRHNGRPIDLTAYPGGRPATLTVQTAASE